MFVLKYDSSGSLLTAKSEGGGNGDRATSVITDNSGGFYLAGVLVGDSIIFGSTTLINEGANDIFVVKYANYLLEFIPPRTNCQINLYPNPTTDAFFLSFDTYVEVGKLVACDMMGKELFNLACPTQKFTPSKTYSFNLPKLPDGFYMLRVVTIDGVKNMKFEVRK